MRSFNGLKMTALNSLRSEHLPREQTRMPSANQPTSRKTVNVMIFLAFFAREGEVDRLKFRHPEGGMYKAKPLPQLVCLRYWFGIKAGLDAQ